MTLEIYFVLFLIIPLYQYKDNESKNHCDDVGCKSLNCLHFQVKIISISIHQLTFDAPTISFKLTQLSIISSRLSLHLLIFAHNRLQDCPHHLHHSAHLFHIIHIVRNNLACKAKTFSAEFNFSVIDFGNKDE